MSVKYPRENNGQIDTGKKLNEVNNQGCPNCGSSQYYQTISAEICPSCRLEFDYWGAGGNAIYKHMEQ